MQYICVTATVAVLQFDAQLAGDVSLLPGVNKILATNLLSNGLTRFVVYGANQSTFAGKFMECTGSISGITEIVAGDVDGNGVIADVITLSQPSGLAIT